MWSSSTSRISIVTTTHTYYTHIIPYISPFSFHERCNPEQKNVYYLVAPSREAALSSPYYETFKKHGTEVLFLYVLVHTGSYCSYWFIW